MSDTATPARDEQIDEWVQRSALSLTLSNVGRICGMDVDDIGAELDGALFVELWPNDAEPGPVTDARTEALTASILARLATDHAREYLLNESARLAMLAATHLEELQRDA